MSQPEKDKVLELVAQGVLSASDGASLLGAISEAERAHAEVIATIPVQSAKQAHNEVQPKQAPEQVVEVLLQRPDGTSYTLQVPPGLAPLIWNLTKAAIKESARTAAQESWAGFKHIVRRKTHEVGQAVRDQASAITRGGSAPALPAIEAMSDKPEHAGARARILEMVSSGLISAEDAMRLIRQIDMLDGASV